MTTLKTNIKLPEVNSQGKITANNIDKITNSDGSVKVGSITVTSNEVDNATGEDGDCYIKYTPKPDTYGVKIEISNSSPDGAVTYIEDAEGMEPGWENWKNNKIFKDIRPCVLKGGVVQYYLNPNNFTTKINGTVSKIYDNTLGDVMIEIPKLGYKMTRDDQYQYISITREPDMDGYCYLAHSKKTEGDCDYIYVGAYIGEVDTSTNTLCSYNSSTTTVTGQTRTNLRTYAAAKGDGYELFSFYPLTLLQCLFLLIYKNRDSQSALGQGYVNNSKSYNRIGSTSRENFNYGMPNSQTISTKFLGIEDFWGNYRYWIDGIYCNSSYQLCTYYKNFTNSDSGTSPDYIENTGISKSFGGYISDIIGTNHGGFTPKETNGSASTYFCDYGGLASSSAGLCGGGNTDTIKAGGFYFVIQSYSANASMLCFTRLLYKHLAS